MIPPNHKGRNLAMHIPITIAINIVVTLPIASKIFLIVSITIPPLLSLGTKVLLNYADCANLIFVGKRQCILVSLDFIKETVTILATMLLHIRVVIDHYKHFHAYSFHLSISSIMSHSFLMLLYARTRRHITKSVIIALSFRCLPPLFCPRSTSKHTDTTLSTHCQ